jgi:microcystin-dependent protein
MADTITPKLGLTKPEVTASNNTWGNKLNVDLDIIDSKMVAQTAQWTITMGDGNPTSTAGHLIVTRYGNDTLRIDDPLVINRQTGAVSMQKAGFPVQASPPTTPAAGNANVYVNANGSLVFQKPDGTIEYVGVPPGTIQWTAGSTADTGWALCNGQSVLRANNPGLSLRIPVGNFGSDATNIVLPDLRGRTLAHLDGGTNRLVNVFNGGVLGNVGGTDTHTLAATQIPSITSGVTVSSVSVSVNVSGSITGTTGAVIGGTGSGVGAQPAAGWPNTTVGVSGTFSGSGTGTGTGSGSASSNNTGGGAHPNAQPTMVLNAQIKLG